MLDFSSFARDFSLIVSIIFRITGMSYEVHKTLGKSKTNPYCDLSFSADGDLLGTSQKNGVISGE